MIDALVNNSLEIVRNSFVLKLASLTSLTIYLAIILTLIYLIYKQNDRYALTLFFSCIGLYAIIEVIKIAVGRVRPNLEALSFPSRHAAFAFFIAFTFPANKKGKLALYVWASLVAVSRLVLAKHWLTDVLFGAGFGLLAGVFLKKIKGKN